MSSTGRPVVLLRSQVLRERLASQHRTHSWFAAEVGISRGYLSRLLSTGRAPSGRIRRRMQEVLGIGEFEVLFAMEYTA